MGFNGDKKLNISKYMLADCFAPGKEHPYPCQVKCREVKCVLYGISIGHHLSYKGWPIKNRKTFSILWISWIQRIWSENFLRLTLVNIGVLLWRGRDMICPPPLILGTTGSIVQIQRAFGNPDNFIEGSKILLTSGSLMTSQITWRHRRLTVPSRIWGMALPSQIAILN